MIHHFHRCFLHSLAIMLHHCIASGITVALLVCHPRYLISYICITQYRGSIRCKTQNMSMCICLSIYIIIYNIKLCRLESTIKRRNDVNDPPHASSLLLSLTPKTRYDLMWCDGGYMWCAAGVLPNPRVSIFLPALSLSLHTPFSDCSNSGHPV